MNAPQEPQNSGLNQYKWLKWLQRIFLILAVIMPFFHILVYLITVINEYPPPSFRWDVLAWILFIWPFVLLTWTLPYLGVPLILIVTHLTAIYYIVEVISGKEIWFNFLPPYYLILVIAGILSIAWGIIRKRERNKMRPVINTTGDQQYSGLIENKWLKWLQRIFLILAIIMPSFYTLIYFFTRKWWEEMEWEVLQWTIFIVPLAILTWFMPILGGILILIGTHLVGFYYIVSLGFGGGGMWANFLLPQYLLLVTGGIISIAWGIVRRHERRRKSG